MARKTKKFKSENFSRVFVLLVVSMLAVIIYCSFYLNKRFDLMKRLKSASNNYNIIFIETNQNNSAISPRQLCAIESAAYRNPSASVVLYTLFPKEGNYSFLLDHYPGLSVQAITPDELFNNTPLLDWYKQGSVLNSTFSVVHVSDAGRLALLLKHGGFYSDLDTIMLKSVETLTQYNGIGYLHEFKNDSLGNGLLHFQANHPFLNFIINILVNKYDPNCWGCNGPLLFIETMKKFCQIDDIYSALLLKPLNRTMAANWTAKMIFEARSKCNLSIFPERYFYPFTWESPELPNMFKPNSNISMGMIFNTFSVHFYGSITSKYEVKLGDGSFYDQLAASNCPRVYENVKANGFNYSYLSS
jgi:lactosylceramide 4-alpha-galactosyltransferase